MKAIKQPHHHGPCINCATEGHLVLGLCRECLLKEAASSAVDQRPLRTNLSGLGFFDKVMDQPGQRIQTRIGCHSFYERFYEWDAGFEAMRVRQGVAPALFKEYRQQLLAGTAPLKEIAGCEFGHAGRPMPRHQKAKEKKRGKHGR